MPEWLQPYLVDVAWSRPEDIVRIIGAILFGGAIGLERELRDKPAGFRTIILISLGACLFSIVSRSVGYMEEESTRIAAQIVSGIGFLGAGAIIHQRLSIVGLTTAATIWVVAAIGMACGFGRLGLAAAGTIGVLVALFLFDSIEHWVGNRRDIQDYTIATPNTDGAFQRVLAQFEQGKITVRKRTCHQEGDYLIVRVVAMGSRADHESLRIRLIKSPDFVVRRSE